MIWTWQGWHDAGRAQTAAQRHPRPDETELGVAVVNNEVVRIVNEWNAAEPVRFTLRDGMDLAGVDLETLWWNYVAIGGAADLFLFADELLGVTPCGPKEHDLIAHTLNEAFIDRGEGTFPVGYSSGAIASPRALSPSAWFRDGASSRADEARRQAALARLRSAAAAQHAASLHATAAQLMLASGQLRFARQAQNRARLAQRRVAPTAA